MIVVIGILAAITIVAFNGVQNRAKQASISSALSQYAKKIAAHQALGGGYPATKEDVGVQDGNGIQYQYTNATSNEYCLTATSGTMTYFVSSANSSVQSGVCSGYNLLAWDETSGTVPVSGGTADTSTFRSSPASVRLGPNMTGRMLNGGPYTGAVGQTYTASVWVKTDGTWNGTNGNSKIRFGNGSSGTLLAACGYGGVKADWVQTTCSFTLDAANTSVGISVGNDGTVGNIWLDDIVVSRS